MPGTPSLTELANAHGVATHVRDGSGRARAVAPEVVEAVLTSEGLVGMPGCMLPLGA